MFAEEELEPFIGVAASEYAFELMQRARSWWSAGWASEVVSLPTLG